MANTKSAKKEKRKSDKRQGVNLTWKKRIKSVGKTLKEMIASKESDILKLREQQSQLQKLLDKAAKNKVLHKNKARRLKSRFAKKVSAHERNVQPKSKSS